MSSRVFSGTVALAAKVFPWTEPEPVLMREGVYLGPQLNTGRPMFLNPQGLISQGLVPSGNWWIMGLIRHGKDTLAKCFATEIGGTQAGVNPNGTHVVPRQRVHDHKLEKGQGEWTRISQFYRTDSVVLADMARDLKITAFDHRTGATEIDNARLAVMIAERVKRDHLDTYEMQALQVVMFVLHGFSIEVPLTFELIRATLRRLTVEQVQTYKGIGLPRLREYYAEQVKQDEDFANFFNLQLDLELDSSLAVASFEALQAASARVESYFSNLLESGIYGGMFGGTVSPYDLLSRRFCHLDWIGVPDEAMIILEEIFQFWEMLGSRKEGGNPVITPHYIYRDEQASELQGAARASMAAEANRKARAVHTVNMSLLQYPSDLLKLGSQGSLLRSHGETMLKGTGAALVGAIDARDDDLDVLTSLGITDFEAFRFTQLSQGQWGLIVRSRPVEFFQHVVKPEQLALIDTTGAARRAGERRPVSETEIFAQRQEELKQLGGVS